MKLNRRVSAWIAVLLLSAPMVQAQGQDGGLNDAMTNRVVSSISTVFEGCAGIAPVYMPDCVGKALQSGASKISNNPAYWEAHVVLTRLSRGLEAAVRVNRDEDASRLRAAGHRLNAVLPGALAAIAAQTEADIARAVEDMERLSPRERDAFEPLRALVAERRPWP